MEITAAQEKFWLIIYYVPLANKKNKNFWKKFNKKLHRALHDMTAVVKPQTVGASVDTILVFDTFKHI